MAVLSIRTSSSQLWDRHGPIGAGSTRDTVSEAFAFPLVSTIGLSLPQGENFPDQSLTCSTCNCTISPSTANTGGGHAVSNCRWKWGSDLSSDRRSDTERYRNGELSIGEAVPSVRQLAKELVINPNTVANAYAELVESGALETQAGRGFFVAKRRQIYTKTERLRRLDESLDVLINQSIALDFELEDVVERLRERFARELKPVKD